jgi:hypothetical protein
LGRRRQPISDRAGGWLTTHTTENIRRIKASLTKLETTTEGLKADLAESNPLMSESKAILAGLPSSKSA